MEGKDGHVAISSINQSDLCFDGQKIGDLSDMHEWIQNRHILLRFDFSGDIGVRE